MVYDSGFDDGLRKSNPIVLVFSTFVIPYMNEQAVWSVFRHTFMEKSPGEWSAINCDAYQTSTEIDGMLFCSVAWWIAYLIAFLVGFIIFAASGKSREILVHLVRLFGA